LAETFAEVSVNETYGDLRVCLKPELFSLLTSADYRQVITGLSLLAA
jgi:hypothetical protein